MEIDHGFTIWRKVRMSWIRQANVRDAETLVKIREASDFLQDRPDSELYVSQNDGPRWPYDFWKRRKLGTSRMRKMF